MLSTGSGRTTVAEVHIKQTDKQSCIRVKCLPIERQEVYIRDYARYYFNQVKGIIDDADEREREDTAEEEKHLEVERVIRNMAKLKNIPSNKAKATTDVDNWKAIQALVGKFVDADAFAEHILSVIALPFRTQQEVPYDGEMPFEQWLKKQFQTINEGNNDNISIAEKIFIEINRKNIDLQLPDCIGEVVDTMGLESGVRPDLQKLILDKDTICFLMDKVSTVPSPNVSTLLKDTYLKQERPYCKSKTAIFVRSPAEDLQAVNEANGDEERGEDIKRSEIDSKVSSENIPYDNNNTIFLDSYMAYDISRVQKMVKDKKSGIMKPKKITRIAAYHEKAALYFRSQMNKAVESMIQETLELLNKDAMNIRASVLVLLKSEQEKAERIAKQEALKELTQKRQALEKERKSLVSRFHGQTAEAAIIYRTLETVHWHTIKKINQLYGAHDLWHTELYVPIAQVGRECFSNAVFDMCKELEKYLIDVRSDIARSMSEGYMHEMKRLEIEYTEAVGQEYFYWAFNEKFAPQSMDLPFWCRVNAEHGTGFKSRVIRAYRSYIDEDVDYLEKIVQLKIEKLFDDVINMLPQ